jgi:hypothetical protein
VNLPPALRTSTPAAGAAAPAARSEHRQWRTSDGSCKSAGSGQCKHGHQERCRLDSGAAKPLASQADPPYSPLPSMLQPCTSGAAPSLTSRPSSLLPLMLQPSSSPPPTPVSASAKTATPWRSQPLMLQSRSTGVAPSMPTCARAAGAIGERALAAGCFGGAAPAAQRAQGWQAGGVGARGTPTPEPLLLLMLQCSSCGEPACRGAIVARGRLLSSASAQRLRMASAVAQQHLALQPLLAWGRQSEAQPRPPG